MWSWQKSVWQKGYKTARQADESNSANPVAKALAQGSVQRFHQTSKLMCGTLYSSLDGKGEAKTTPWMIQIHAGMGAGGDTAVQAIRHAWQQVKQDFPTPVHLSRTQPGAIQDGWIEGIDFLGQAGGVSFQEELGVVGMGVKILPGMAEAPESLPGVSKIAVPQGRLCLAALSGEVGFPGLKAIVVKMVFRVEEQTGQPILH